LLITNSKLNIKFPVVIGERLEARKPFWNDKREFE
jgi:hypothetical protein